MNIQNKYKLIKELGRGGMGVVYHVLDIQLNRECALKILHNATEKSWQRFTTEARSIAKLNHDNIIKMYEIDTFTDNKGNKQPYFTMEYIPGISLEEWINKEHGNLKLCLTMFHKICSAIAYAHNFKIIHRDLKPHNILVTSDNTPIVLDFGLAKNIDDEVGVTKTGEIFGTPKYLAPEIPEGVLRSNLGFSRTIK
ncbi:serine/threonine-protein kinase [Candidatus Uabimicrobium sp. HlEnr_7]|uniref:serine/threonine-protein kinase n=1 Tax=Candidatus Uabimicrobium helgolandensis TaxID=3095367 RepID=UPI0035560BAE